jgi:flagella basal body P-ring formation protein FlgA
MLAMIAAPLLLTSVALAQSATPHQDPAALRDVVEQYLKRQSAGLPGDVQVSVGQVDARLNLPACLTPEAFSPQGSRIWGKTSVGVRCTAPSPWVVYISAQVKVIADYVASAVPLSQGQVVGTTDIMKIKGDLTALPAGVLTDPQFAVGRTVAMSIGMGSPLRQDSLKLQQVIVQGQAVRVVSTGAGFSVATEARALNNAAAGQMAQARTAGGQVVSGIARNGGVVEVTF